ncbi:arginyl-tRNA synthetase [Candidatus Termititenax persephonae]|uniref:Arginine--tRNA ligase n=1 Tax=Candidatus Termititenax persephonae TaxID=2218525 RepID=A0A388THC7_9BACT|nr:arginyl-tRNA synthetase [Candidatus Termititenax persephonae]
MSIRAQIQKLLQEAAGENTPVALAEPKNLDYGDYATNIALRLAKTRQKAPQVIAQELLEKLREKTTDYTFTEINGFINVRISDQTLFAELAKINPDYAKPDNLVPEKILLEYVSANPTGPLHIGHGRWAVIGDILARTLAYCGHQVTKEFYINDAGKQIANFVDSVNAARQNQPPPADGYHGAYIAELARLDGDPVQTMLDWQKTTLKNIRTEFDNWFSEKTLHASGAVEQALAILQPQTYVQDGSLWFKSTDYGDDKDRVLIKSNGEKTYFTADIAYHKNKLDRGFTRLINIWGADHHGYIARVRAAIQALTGSSAQPLRVILGQLVNLYRGGELVKMSKRTGEMITLQEVLAEIGTDAARYFLAMRSADTALDFDLALAKEQSSDNPVYYVQYAHARICSILRQADASLDSPPSAAPKLHPAERLLILKIIRLPDELESVAADYAIQRLCAYAQELAALFHNFYHECKVISEDRQATAQRLSIIRGTQAVLKIVFNLLAIEAPEKM